MRWLALLAVAPVLGLFLCPYGSASRPASLGGTAMDEAQAKARSAIRLADDDYFDVSTERLTELQSRIAGEEGGVPVPPRPGSLPFVLAAGAPRTIDTARRSTLPVLVATRLSGQRRWEVEYNHNAWFVVSDLITGRVTAARPFVPGKRELNAKPSMRGTPPNAINAATLVNAVRTVDVRSFAPVEWQRGRVAVTVVYFDTSSNTVVVELMGAEREKRALPTAPSSFLLPIAAPDPRAAGVCLSVPEKAGAGPVHVRGSVEVIAEHAAVFPGAGGEGHILSAALLLLKRDEPEPVYIGLAAPVSKHGESFRGSFEFDLRKAVDGADLAGAYQAWLVAGDRVVGPRPITVESK
ncbi:MAG TPA: hypothetical protein VN428_09285 [Bryobacteraceae bacterium]|nr:hypothetical protein [Bryobacteraceae bacterium]